MDNPIAVHLGSPLENQSEREFLTRLCEDLQERRQEAIIFGNFSTRRNPLQIDFFIITQQCACLVELKNITCPVLGDTNGDWLLQLPDRSEKTIGSPNPYQQAVQCKYALSDEVESLVGKNDPNVPRTWGSKKFFTAIECVVCVFPSLKQGSKVPADYKAKVLDYLDLLNLLGSSRVNPQWNKQHWLTLASHLGLKRQVSSNQLEDTSVEGAKNAVAQYLLRFRDSYGATLPSLVPTSWKRGTGLAKADSLLTILSASKHVQIVGPSGSGKTHLVMHMALFAQSLGTVVILVKAKNYDGILTELVDSSIAHLHEGTGADLLQYCSRISRSVALIVDGVNECPSKLLPDLLQDLQAFYLRHPITILITSQQVVQLPQHLVGELLNSLELTKEERREILQCYSRAEITKELEILLEPFRTAFELSLAVESAPENTERVIRAALFEQYTRRCLGRTRDNLGVRQVLIDIAALMNDRLVTSLPLPEVERLAHARKGTKREQLTLIKEVLSCSLLEFHPGLCSFRHEMLQTFFEAEALLRDHPLILLPADLSRAQNRHLAEFTVAMIPDENAVRSCLHALSDAALLKHSLMGLMGNIPRQVLHKDGLSLIQAALKALSVVQFNAPVPFKWDKPITISEDYEWSQYELALMRAMGRALHEGIFLEEVFQLIQRTDRTSGMCLPENGPEDLPSERRSHLFQYLYIFECVKWPTAPILVHCHNDFSDTDEAVIDKVLALNDSVPELTPGQLYLTSLFLRQHGALQAKCMEKLLDKLPELFRSCWGTRIYHLQLEALQLLQSYASVLEGQGRAKIENILTSLNSRHLGISSQLVETMSRYNLVESPVSSLDAEKEIAEILGSPNDQFSQERAYRIVSCQFEDVFQDTYYTAIQELEVADRIRLLTMAALGAASYSYWLDWLLEELVKANDPYALPAFEKWATEIDAVGTFIQGSVAAFVLGRIGCAKFMDYPPSLKDIHSDDHRAWQIYGDIIFWIHKAGLSEWDMQSRCAPLWHVLQTDLRFEAVDPIMRFGQSQKMQGDGVIAINRWLTSFKEPVLQILEYGLVHRTELSTLFQRPLNHIQKDLTAFIIKELGEIGTSETIKILEPLIDSDDFGISAVQAIRRLKQAPRS